MSSQLKHTDVCKRRILVNILHIGEMDEGMLYCFLDAAA